VSWFQEHARLSLSIIEQTGVPRNGKIIDIGGGAGKVSEAPGVEPVFPSRKMGAPLYF
jgi:hypothetical protein